jgi:hypothetical protein
LQRDKIKEFRSYLTSQSNLPLPKLFSINAHLSLERGQYSLAVLQGAIAVELRTAQVVIGKLKTAGWSEKAIASYEKKTLGGKLQIPQTDPRSLESYFNDVDGFTSVYNKARGRLVQLRNNVGHRGCLASRQEAIEAVQIAADFLSIVN